MNKIAMMEKTACGKRAVAFNIRIDRARATRRYWHHSREAQHAIQDRRPFSQIGDHPRGALPSAFLGMYTRRI